MTKCIVCGGEGGGVRSHKCRSCSISTKKGFVQSAGEKYLSNDRVGFLRASYIGRCPDGAKSHIELAKDNKCFCGEMASDINSLFCNEHLVKFSSSQAKTVSIKTKCIECGVTITGPRLTRYCPDHYTLCKLCGKRVAYGLCSECGSTITMYKWIGGVSFKSIDGTVLKNKTVYGISIKRSHVTEGGKSKLVSKTVRDYGTSHKCISCEKYISKGSMCSSCNLKFNTSMISFASKNKRKFSAWKKECDKSIVMYVEFLRANDYLDEKRSVV